MKNKKYMYIIAFFLFCFPIPVYGQNISVDSIKIDDFNAPDEGESIFYLENNNEEYRLEQSWTNSNGVLLNESDVFQAGETYIYTLKVTPKENYYFSDNIDISIENTKNDNWNTESLNLLEFGYYFNVNYIIKSNLKSNSVILDSWFYSDDKIYYYKNGEKLKGINEVDGKKYFFGVTGGAVQKGLIEYYGDYYYADPITGELYQGLKIINNEAFIFGEDFKAIKGLTEYKGELYYSNPETSRLSNLVTEVDGKKYFFGRTTYKALRGWIDYNGSTYYADLNTGVLNQNGVYEVDGKQYFFGRTGCAVQKGLIEYYGDYYYADPITGELYQGLKIINNEAFIFGEDFKAIKGLTEYKGELYYSNPETSRLSNLVTEVDGKKYFFGRTTYKALRGWIDYNESTYYADLNTGVLNQNGVYEVDGKQYFFGRTGCAVQKGLIEYYGDYYYADPITGKLNQGLKIINNEAFIFGEDFKAIKGLTEYKGELYYSNPETSRLSNLVTEVDGKKYFFGRTTYKALRGWIDYNGKTYYADLNTGVLKLGINYINNIMYNFSYDGCYLSAGMVTYEGNNYYFNNKGTLSYGWIKEKNVYYADKDTGILYKGLQKVDNIPYFFGVTKSALQYGLISYNGDWYYSDPTTGVIQNLINTVNGNGYFFGRTTYRAQTGWISYEGNLYYADSQTGILKSLVNEVDGKKYFFGRTTYKVLKGWINYNGLIYYTNGEGVIQTGYQVIDGNAYCFNNDGVLQTGWQTIDGKKYYFYADGTRAKYISKIAGVRYEFAADGVLQYSNIKHIVDVSAHQGYINWDQLWSSGQIDGVILRIAAGAEKEDAKLAEYINNVKRLGIPYGIYIYSYAENYDEGVLYGNFTKNIINKYNLNPSLGVYLDLESNSITNYMGVSQYEQVVKGFMDVIPYAKVYTYTYYANTSLNSNYIHQYITWIANYSVTDRPGNYQGWQYTSKGSLPGINGNVDLNVFYY